MKLLNTLAAAALLLAACTSGEAEPQGPGGPPTATAPPPAYSEPAEPISSANITRVEYLGRLDAPGRPSTIFRHSFSPDGTRLVALNNELIVAWDLISGEVVFRSSRETAAWIFYSPDKTELYAVSTEGAVTVYNADRGTIENGFQGHTAFNGAAAFHPNEGWLALAGGDGTFKVWDTYARQSIVTVTAENAPIEALAFSQDGSLMAAAARNGIVSVWDWRERQRVANFAHEGTSILSMVFSPDGRRMAISTPAYAAVWSITEDTFEYALQTAENQFNDLVLFSPDGRYLVSGGQSPALQVWDAENAELVAALPDIGGPRISVVFSPDGDLLLTSVLDRGVALWNIAAATPDTVPRADINPGTNRIIQVDWTADGYTMALFDAGGPVYLWGIRPGGG